MKFKDVAISDASTEAKVAALAVLLDKELLKLAETVLNVQAIQGPQGEQGLQGPKGEQGDRGLDGTNGKDGSDGKDGKDGAEGKQGVGVADAKIDFDGSLVITLTDGTEINAGEIVPLDTAEKIRVIGNGGGTSQNVLDAIEALQATIATYGTMATQNANAVAITGGSINGTTVGSTTAAAGTFTALSTGTLTATGQTSLGGAAGSESFRALNLASSVNWIEAKGSVAGTGASGIPTLFVNGSDTNTQLGIGVKGTSGYIKFFTSGAVGTEQFRIAAQVSAVNYVQVTGAATTVAPQISAQGSDTNVGFSVSSKGTGQLGFYTNSVNANSRHLDITHTGSVVNRFTLTGSQTGFGVTLGLNGTDTNISQVFQSKGTGAIDLAAGSRGVNISNGGTVTALTRTATGNGSYTSKPTITISAPTTAGGVQATATIDTMGVLLGTVQSGGTGYTVGDSLSVVGGTGGPQIFTVATVSGGVVTGVTNVSFAPYSVTPTNPVSTTGGTGTGCTLNLGYNVNTTFTITNAGSGYVEQPTVSFSGGGGSGAAAYATVGSVTTIKSIGSASERSLAFQGPSGFDILQLAGDAAMTTQETLRIQPTQFGRTNVIALGGTNSQMWLSANGTGYINLSTGGTSLTTQARVTHTASAVNYVQVTGAATTQPVVIGPQGSDTNVGMLLRVKGAPTGPGFRIENNNGANVCFAVTTSGSNVANYMRADPAAAGSATGMSAQGSDANIDLALTPKGTGNVRFGTYTASMALTVQGYIEIKDSGGTVRRLAVVA